MGLGASLPAPSPPSASSCSCQQQLLCSAKELALPGKSKRIHQPQGAQEELSREGSSRSQTARLEGTAGISRSQNQGQEALRRWEIRQGELQSMGEKGSFAATDGKKQTQAQQGKGEKQQQIKHFPERAGRREGESSDYLQPSPSTPKSSRSFNCSCTKLNPGTLH